MQYYYNPVVQLLLISKSEEDEYILYNDNQSVWEVPKIGPRPPYYANPIYEPYYPVI